MTGAGPSLPNDKRAVIAVDLGAESCRVSMLRWVDGKASVELVHRFANSPQETGDGLRWDLGMIAAGLEDGLRRCASLASEGVRSIAVDGWAVDYVRIDADCKPLEDPFCYRDERLIAAQAAVYKKIPAARIRELTGVELIRINTVYQLYADALAGRPPGVQWLGLPEYFLAKWGGTRVYEHTNATHTQMVELFQPHWCVEIFDALGLDPRRALPIVPPGTVLGKAKGTLAELSALRDTVLIAPACHDTASAIAGIPAVGNDWAYISSGTWSLVGTLLEQPRNGAAAAAENFTNLGAVGGRTCFHKNVNGMWLIRQCMDVWAAEGTGWTIQELVAAAERAPKADSLLEVDESDLLLAGGMPGRINAQRVKKGLPKMDESAAGAPAMARLIFESLAARYAEVLGRISVHSSKEFTRLFVVGGASQNEFLNRLTAEATGLKVFRGSSESSTVGNLAVQLAVLDGDRDDVTGAFAENVSHWAEVLIGAMGQ
jgi:rhamnulokinase